MWVAWKMGREMWVADTLQRGPEAVGEGADPSGAPPAGRRPRPEPRGHRTDTAGVTLPSPRGPFSGGCPPLRQCRAGPAFEGFWAQLPSAEAPLPGREHLPPPGQRSCRSPWSPRPTRVGLPAGPPPAGPGTPPFPASSGGQRGLCSHRLQAARALGGSPSGDASRPAGTCQKITQPLERFSTNRALRPELRLSPQKCQARPMRGPKPTALRAQVLAGRGCAFATSCSGDNRPADALQGGERAVWGQRQASEREAGAAAGAVRDPNPSSALSRTVGWRGPE